METIVYLIRHGETDWNHIQKIQGHTDTDLNELGYKQAEKLANRLASEGFAHVYSSDLKRAFETAKRVGERQQTPVPVTKVRGLRERCYGDWEGRHLADVQKDMLAVEPHQSICGIESYHAMQKRADRVLSEIIEKHPGQKIAVVSHGGLINAFLHYITDGQLGTGITKIGNTGITILHVENKSWKVMEISRIDHLEETITD
ncbi:phosphoglycerate mutase [Brevibacillus sp. SKDU10]|uniref:histidine phosphatase family protein n=1 Tax=Brevibacillus sp. SKDU10 TaxID=1247872 RepID=UPI0007C8D91F|nr:histidine phosphatase family protein [Brevibacillus sp. SKDU10]OAJ74935.1 phosphoglycerate mutase [Brevibacillus sp. SKDU10]